MSIVIKENPSFYIFIFIQGFYLNSISIKWLFSLSEDNGIIQSITLHSIVISINRKLKSLSIIIT